MSRVAATEGSRGTFKITSRLKCMNYPGLDITWSQSNAFGHLASGEVRAAILPVEGADCVILSVNHNRVSDVQDLLSSGKRVLACKRRMLGRRSPPITASEGMKVQPGKPSPDSWERLGGAAVDPVSGKQVGKRIAHWYVVWEAQSALVRSLGGAERTGT
jgi:hypothetical protein